MPLNQDQDFWDEIGRRLNRWSDMNFVTHIFLLWKFILHNEALNFHIWAK